MGVVLQSWTSGWNLARVAPSCGTTWVRRDCASRTPFTWPPRSTRGPSTSSSDGNSTRILWRFFFFFWATHFATVAHFVSQSDTFSYNGARLSVTLWPILSWVTIPAVPRVTGTTAVWVTLRYYGLLGCHGLQRGSTISESPVLLCQGLHVATTVLRVAGTTAVWFISTPVLGTTVLWVTLKYYCAIAHWSTIAYWVAMGYIEVLWFTKVLWWGTMAYWGAMGYTEVLWFTEMLWLGNMAY